MKKFAAPWGRLLIVVSCLVTALCIGISLTMMLSNREVLFWAGMIPVAIVAATAPFTIRGYTLTRDSLLVHRLFWKTGVPLAGLKSAEVKPAAMSKSLRTCGNGGLFAFSGCFYSKTLGSYRAFVTDLNRTVVLRFPDRVIVVSPDRPEEFVREIGALAGVSQREPLLKQ